jgi:hypothetical protein
MAAARTWGVSENGDPVPAFQKLLGIGTGFKWLVPG